MRRRSINVKIRHIDPLSDIHKYRIWCCDGVGSPVRDFPQTIEFTPSDTVPLKQLLKLVPRGFYDLHINIEAPTKLLPTDAKELPKAIDWTLRTLNCPARIVRSPKTRRLRLNCERLPPAWAFKDDRLSTLIVDVARQQYWPVQLAPVTQNTATVEFIAANYRLDSRYLLVLHCLDQLVKCGLAAEPTSPWSVFLKKGLYDPRLLLHITAFVLPFLVQ